MMTHPIHVSGKSPIRTLVARQLPTNIYIQGFIQDFFLGGGGGNVHVL